MSQIYDYTVTTDTTSYLGQPLDTDIHTFAIYADDTAQYDHMIGLSQSGMKK